ncbi:hypothetical protein [Neobacillus niacini]|uniref:hypothetical protein n=1 Tax=Neobacillus niacini TaxID=86668 RepID=UPI00203A517F|nr:hypothetical protein [Neobacillus niacini]MCM3690820.1 hypothetical protein [Neobacillus niacini]
MRKGVIFTLLFLLGISTFITGCGSSSDGKENNANVTPNKNSNGEQIDKFAEQDKQNGKDSMIDNGGLVNMEDVKVKLTFINEEVIVAEPTNDLIILGEIESGKENFENIQGDFTVHIEKID